MADIIQKALDQKTEESFQMSVKAICKKDQELSELINLNPKLKNKLKVVFSQGFLLRGEYEAHLREASSSSSVFHN